MKIIDASLVEIIDRCRELIDSAMSEAGLPNRRAVPDRSIYRILSEGTDSFGLIVEDKGKPIGFASVFVFTHQHSGEVFAQNDAIYLSPEYRNTSIGGRLAVLAERKAIEAGAKFFLWDVPEDSPLATALAKRVQGRKHLLFFKEL